MHERFDVFETRLLLQHKVANGLGGLFMFGILVLNHLQLQLFLPGFAKALQLAGIVHLGELIMRLGLQLLKLGLPLVKITHNGLELRIELVLILL